MDLTSPNHSELGALVEQALNLRKKGEGVRPENGAGRPTAGLGGLDVPANAGEGLAPARLTAGVELVSLWAGGKAVLGHP